MTFLEFFNARRAVAVPDGDSRRLDVRHKNWVRSDLITIQKYATCYQTGNKTIFTSGTDECGATYVVEPYGRLTDATIRDTTTNCDTVQCVPVTPIVMRRYQKRWQLCQCTSATASSGGGSGGSGGGGGSSSTFGIQGVTALRALAPEAYQTYALLWLNAEDDGAGGWFVYRPDSSAADDGIDYIIPNNVTRPALGAFVRSNSL